MSNPTQTQGGHRIKLHRSAALSLRSLLDRPSSPHSAGEHVRQHLEPDAHHAPPAVGRGRLSAGVPAWREGEPVAVGGAAPPRPGHDAGRYGLAPGLTRATATGSPGEGPRSQPCGRRNGRASGPLRHSGTSGSALGRGARPSAATRAPRRGAATAANRCGSRASRRACGSASSRGSGSSARSAACESGDRRTRRPSDAVCPRSAGAQARDAHGRR